MTDTRIHQLLEELMDSGLSPEEVCRDCPELLPEVRERWQRVRALMEEAEVAFPPGKSAIDAQHPERARPLHRGDLPAVPGYDAIEFLGSGGMGMVYKARHQKLNRTVAIKMLVAGEHASPGEVQRFLLESEVLASLRHPNIVQVFDVGELPGRPYFTMEFMEGGTLAQSLAGSAMPSREAASLLETLALAVQAIHQAGIVHRDLKPSNILLTADRIPKIADCGVARRLGSSSGITIKGVRVGTPSYMAPEQAAGSAGGAAPAVDVYALGAILYEALTGRPPFRSETPEATARQVLVEEPVPPRRHNPTVPLDLDTICLKCLSKDSQRRYATAADLAADLNRYLSGEPIEARRSGHLERMVKWTRRQPAHALALATCVVFVLALSGATVWAAIRRAENNRAVSRDVQQAVAFAHGSNWAGAREMLDKAKVQLGNGGDADLVSAIRRLEDDLALIARLEEIRMDRARFAGPRRRLADQEAGRAYGEVLNAAGIVVLNAPPAESAAIIRSSHIRSALIAVLDEWAWCDASVRDRLTRILAEVDADPWRNRVRATAEVADRASLEELAASANVAEQPPQLLRLLGERLHVQGGDGISFLRTVQERHPSDFWANYDLGFHISASDPREAIGYFRAAVSLRADAAPAHFNLGVLLYRTQRWDEAIRHLERAMELAPQHAATHVSLGVCLLRKGDLDRACAHLREAIRIDPNDAESHGFLAAALGMAGRMPEAIAEYREALRIDPTIASVHNNLAKALATIGDTDGAIVEYQEAIRLNPRSATSRAGIAALFRARGRYRDAAEHFQAVTEIEPSNMAARRDLRGVLMRLGETARVRDQWRSELANSPADHEAWNGYAELSLFLGSPSDYHQVCDRLLDRFGTTTDPYIAERTARTCLLLPASQESVGRAATLVNVALNAESSTYADWALPFFYFAQGLVEYRLGRFEAAVAIMSAQASNVLGPAPQLVTAMAQHQLGRHEEARSTLAAAVVSFDWQRANADNLDAWTCHLLRREAEAALLPQIPEFLAGTYQPRDNNERLILQAACQFEGRYDESARLYAESFTVEPRLAEDLRTGLRYKAACAAARAGRDADDQSPAWREQSRQWLQADVLLFRNSAVDASARPHLLSVLNKWRTEPDLASTRDPEDLARMSEDERARFKALWAEVRALEQACEDQK